PHFIDCIILRHRSWYKLGKHYKWAGTLRMTTTLLKRSDFIGRLCKEVDLREFVIKETVDQADREVPRHTHEDAHFLLIVDGVYITSATRVAGQCLSSTLIFN